VVDSGEKTTTSSLFPVGSVTKTYVTVSALRLHEKGLLDLDAPFLAIVEPWLKRQGLPSLASLWPHPADRAHLSAITSRQLLSMESGMPDYDDEEMQAWTKRNPGKDYTPFDYLGNCRWSPI
jgi:CubicO group peptidase (beta-lactamase class C family)